MGPPIKARFVMNGDVLTDLDFDDLLRRHESSDTPLTVIDELLPLLLRQREEERV